MGNIIRLNEHIICTEVEDSFAVWFGASHKFMMLEEPAFFVLQQIIENKTVEEIVQECVGRYQNPVKESQQFVSEVYQITQQYIALPENSIHEETDSFIDRNSGTDFYSEKFYVIGNSFFNINYGDAGLEAVIHPLISHFEVTKNEIALFRFDINRNSDKLFFKVDGDILETLKSDETGYLKAAVLLKFLEILYGIEKGDWMMTLHAAAATDGNCAIVFPAKAGSGKSTLSALLNSHGFKLLSDDFLAMDFNHQKIYPLPVAATIKEGSVDVLSLFYPELRQIPVEHAYTGKQVRYLPVNKKFTPNEGYLAKYFVFITYLPHSPCLFNEVPKKVALQSLLEETWVNPTPSSVTEFFNWFDKTKFFELKYSKTSDAIKIVTKLFKE